MRFSLDLLPARKGDCLLLHFGTKAKPGLVMIDGGPKTVYAEHLKPRLLDIRKLRGLGPQQPLPVDLLMVSHVDDDHIQGILDLTRELRAAGAGQAPLVRVAGIWHNSFDDLLGSTPKELTASVASQFGAASLAGGLPDDAAVDLGADASDADNEIAHATLSVLASIEQGYRLRGDAEALGWQRNPYFDGKLILADSKPRVIRDGLSFTAVGPMLPELKELQKKHDEWVRKQQEKKTTPESSLAAYVDKSVPNLSSIVMLAECGGKRILLTGDARGDKVMEGLEADGLLKKGGKIHVDILKVPHHGSSNNVDQDFYDRISADHYVFSGDGEHGNPERESLEMLFKARSEAPFTIHFTYPIAEIDAARKAEWNKQQTAETRRKQKKKRPNWSPPQHGLAAFFATHKLAQGQKIVVVGDQAAHVIDLLDPLAE